MTVADARSRQASVSCQCIGRAHYATGGVRVGVSKASVREEEKGRKRAKRKYLRLVGGAA